MVRRRFRSISPKTGERNQIKACSCNKEADVIWSLFYVSVLLEIDQKIFSLYCKYVVNGHYRKTDDDCGM